MEKEKEKALKKLLSCVICQEIFSKNNKPLIMFCGHNICEECKLKNFKKITCSICKKVFSKREIKKFQINYLILENKNISQGEVSTNQENSQNFLLNMSPEIRNDIASALINQAMKQMDKIQIDDKKEDKNIEENELD